MSGKSAEVDEHVMLFVDKADKGGALDGTSLSCGLLRAAAEANRNGYLEVALGLLVN